MTAKRAMDPRLQRRVQRHAWDLAADGYEPLWHAQLAGAQAALLAAAALAPGERVLDVACGTGLVTFLAGAAVGPRGSVLGVDLSPRMVEAAARRAAQLRAAHVACACMDAERLALPAAGIDAALCALGLMYVCDPAQALRELRRVLRPGGRAALLVWGERSRCGWAAAFEIVAAEVRSDVCPLFFELGHSGALARLCSATALEVVAQQRLAATLDYADADQACDAMFVAGPVALAWSHFDAGVRARVRSRYLESIEPWRRGARYEVPAEFVVVVAHAPGAESKE